MYTYNDHEVITISNDASICTFYYMEFICSTDWMGKQQDFGGILSYAVPCVPNGRLFRVDYSGYFIFSGTKRVTLYLTCKRITKGRFWFLRASTGRKQKRWCWEDAGQAMVSSWFLFFGSSNSLGKQQTHQISNITSNITSYCSVKCVLFVHKCRQYLSSVEGVEQLGRIQI